MEEALVWAVPSSQASKRVEGSPPAHAANVGFMGAESEIKPGNRKATPQESLEPGKEKPQFSPCHYPCSLSQCCLPCLLAATTVILSPAPPSHDDLEPKGGAREAEVSFSPWSSGFVGHISCISSLLLFYESESLYPAGLSPSLLGSLNLGGETEVKRGLWLSESPKLNSDASTLPFQALLTQFIKQKCEPLCPPLHLCEMG